MWPKILLFSLVIGLIPTPLILPQSVLSAELQEIQRRGKLIVAVKDNLRPLAFLNGEGNLQGLEIDLARGLAEELLGNPEAIVLQPVSNRERLDVVMDGTVDLAIARVTATTPRSRLVNFSPYYYLDRTGIVTKKDSVRSLGNLTGGTVAVLNGSSTIAVIRSELPNAQLIGVDSYQEALGLLENDRADAFATDNSVLAGWIQEYPQYRQLPVHLSGEALCVVMPKGLQYVELHTKVNDAIRRWHQSGWLQTRITYWGLP